MADRARVLLVDDEENLLNGLRRQLGNKYDISFATSGASALDMISTGEPFSVIVSDMRMPGMDGVELLDAVRRKSPLSTRMMLTGNADQGTAVKAINEGNIFRFFNKPCDAAILNKGISDGIEQYRLQTAEKKLIETTLAGSVKLLSEVISFSYPNEKWRRDTMRYWAKKIATTINLTNAWELDLAVMLSRVGYISIPSNIIDKLQRQETLTESEMSVYDSYPEIGHRLVSNIPRLENIADGILYQRQNFDGTGVPNDGLSGEEIPVLGRILRILNDMAELTFSKIPGHSVFEILDEKAHFYDGTLLTAAKDCLGVSNLTAEENGSPSILEALPVYKLRSGMALIDDLMSPDGRLILAKDSVLTEVQVQRILAIHKMKPMNNLIEVSHQVAS